MKKSKSLFALSLLLVSVLSQAGIIRTNAVTFTKVGSIQNVHWAPARYTNGWKYDVLYFIPKSLKDASAAKALIYMHGGGGSTVTRSGSLSVAQGYMSDAKQLAEDTNSVVVVPSASGLNWGAHTYMLRELAQTIKAELDIDPDNIGLTGHSMGGMGITRAYTGLVDEFAYIMPMSAGMDLIHQTEDHLLKAFNVPYVHLQGKNDHFTVFIERCNEQLKRMTALEAKIGTKSKFELIYYNGSHNPDYALTLSTLKRLQASPRNLYQPTLYGVLLTRDEMFTENGVSYHLGSLNRYFWVSLLEADKTRAEGLGFVAKISGNEINLSLSTKPEMIKKLRILLSKKMLDLSRPVTIKVNGEIKAIHTPGTDTVSGSADSTDAKFIFEEYADIVL